LPWVSLTMCQSVALIAAPLAEEIHSFTPIVPLERAGSIRPEVSDGGANARHCGPSDEALPPQGVRVACGGTPRGGRFGTSASIRWRWPSLAGFCGELPSIGWQTATDHPQCDCALLRAGVFLALYPPLPGPPFVARPRRRSGAMQGSFVP